ncbi:hypothetical protein CEN46_23810 [Fischerella thermalis CCMEE 5318]|uniref:Uncharacterized protein n=1 Tax=Fischerella thermalis CCMEE 5318 TaxID=2019666 RepID=A0A2N6L5Z5_9CYAN|nr:hypothetical protein CEN46_23810 [Fischerella thermalis CCMEE 5318]
MVGCWLLVVGCWLLVVDCWLLIVGCWLLVVSVLPLILPTAPNPQRGPRVPHLPTSLTSSSSFTSNLQVVLCQPQFLA